jgi:hypothetical protein
VQKAALQNKNNKTRHPELLGRRTAYIVLGSALVSDEYQKVFGGRRQTANKF